MSENKKYNLEPVNFQDKKNLSDLEKFLLKNGEPGRFCGFQSLHQYYTHKDSGCTDWTGHPGMGKTYFVLEILFNLSELHGKRHILYVPDIGNYRDIIVKLIKMHTGKNFNSKYGNQATMEDIYSSLAWLSHHFIVLKRRNIKESVTPSDFWEYVCAYEDKGGKAHTGLIDSWKNMYHEFGGKREDQYLDGILSYRNELSEEYNKHFHTIAHSIKTDFDDPIAGAKRKRRIPDAHDIKGGGSWYANGKNIITVDFPDKTSNKVNLYISKIKPEGIGKIGSITDQIFLDINKGRYYEVYNERKRFSSDPLISEIKQEKINLDEKTECPF